MATVILKRLLQAQEDEEEELFTTCRIVGDDGFIAADLDAVVTVGPTGRSYAFLYDRASLSTWRERDGTLPETRQRLNESDITTVPIS